MHHCKARYLLSRHQTIQLTDRKSLLGHPPRTHLHHSLRPTIRPFQIRVLHLPQHNPVNLRRLLRLHLPPHFLPLLQQDAPHLPHDPHPLSAGPRCHHLLPRFPFRLRFPSPYRLHYLYPRQILQTPTCNVSPPDNIPETLSLVQVPRRFSSDCRRRSLHGVSPIYEE